MIDDTQHSDGGGPRWSRALPDASRGHPEQASCLDGIIGFAEKALAYTAQLDQDGFLRDGLTYHAILHSLGLIGEAATHVAASLRAANPQILWRLIIAPRNRLIHGYLGIVDGVVHGWLPTTMETSWGNWDWIASNLKGRTPAMVRRMRLCWKVGARASAGVRSASLPRVAAMGAWFRLGVGDAAGIRAPVFRSVAWVGDMGVSGLRRSECA